MAGVDKKALSAQLNADPRVQRYIAQKYPNGTRGAAGVPADVLLSWGFDVPPGYSVAVQGRGVQVYDQSDKWDKIIPAAAGTVMGVGGLGMLGVGPLAGGGAVAPTAAGDVLPLVTPGYNMAPVIPGVAAGAAKGGSGGMLGAIMGGLSKAGGAIKNNPGALAGLLPLIGQFTGGGGFGGGGGSNAEDDAFLRQAYEDAQYSQGLKEARFRRVDPLHESITQLAFNRMPDNARQGIDLTRVPLPERRR